MRSWSPGKALPFASVPPAAQWSLPLLYLTWAIVVALLYVICQWFAGVKQTRRDTWLRYI